MKRSLVYTFFTLLILTGGFIMANSYSDSTTGTIHTNWTPSAGNKVQLPTAPKAAAKNEFLSVENKSIVLFNTEVFESSVDVVINRLEQARKDNVKDVYLIITSPGGSVLAGGRLVDYMQSSPLHITTVCQTICASMAAHIFEAGAERLILPKSLLMFHRASMQAEGTMEQMQSELAAFKLIVDRMDQNASDRSGIPYAQFKDIIGRDLWLDGESAVSMKLADKLAFISFDVAAADVFSVKERMRLLNIHVPPEVGFYIPTSVKNVYNR